MGDGEGKDMQVNRYRKLLVLLCSLSAMLSMVAVEWIELNFDSLYPRNDYFHVERVLKELWSDIELLLQDPYLYGRFLYESDYIVDQYLALEKKLEQLVNRDSDFSSYLLEDIAYLDRLIDHLTDKTFEMCQNLDGDHAEEVSHEIYAILARCRDYIALLYQQNKEVLD